CPACRGGAARYRRASGLAGRAGGAINRAVGQKRRFHVALVGRTPGCLRHFGAKDGRQAMSEERSRKRAGGRAGMKTRAGTAAIDQMPWRIPLNPDRPVEPLDADGVMRIHKGAMRILSEIGIEFLNPEAVEHLKAAGCKVNGTNVRMDEDFVMEMMGRAPSSFTITPRNPE